MAENGGFLDDWQKANDLSKARFTAQEQAEAAFGRDLATEQLVTNGSKPIEIQNIIDGRSVSNGLAPFITKATNEYERRQALLGGQII